PDRFVPTRRKVAGFTEAYARHLGENDAEEHIVTTLFTLEGGQVAAGKLIDSGNTAIICGSDMMALGAVRAARQRNLAVPDDVSVVGYDDSPLIAFTDPPLTTVRQPVQGMSRSAVSALISEISRSEERRVGKECRTRWASQHYIWKSMNTMRQS